MKLNEFIDIVKNDPNKLFESYSINSYIPFTRKMAICEIATIGADDMPPLLIERDETGYATVSSINRVLWLAQVYLSEYFGVELDNFDTEEYDTLYAEDILPKIDRLADRGSNSKHKRTVCQIQDDFRQMEKLLNKEVANEIGRINDPYKRILQRMDDDLTPEAMKSGVSELKEVIAQIEQRKNK